MFGATPRPQDTFSNDTKEAARQTLRSGEATYEKAKDDLAAAANQAGQKVRNVVDNASEEVSQATKQATQYVQTATQDVRGHIEQNPLQSMLITLGIGAFLGALLSRR